MVRILYNTDAPEAGTGGAAIASLMATQGVKSEPNSTAVSLPMVGGGQKTESEPTVNTEPPVAPTEPVKQPEPVEPVSQNTEPPVASQPAPVSIPTVSPPTWQEVLKQQSSQAVLKELLGNEDAAAFASQMKNVDPKMIAFFQKWQSGEDLIPYLKELTTDYSKMAAEDIMRSHLRTEYPKATEAQIEALFKRQVVNAYSLDSEDELEREEGRLLLEAIADKHRQTFVNKQQEYLLPKYSPAAPEVDPAEAIAAEAERVYVSNVKEGEFTKSVLSNKQLVFGEGDEKFNYPVEPSQLLDLILDNDKFRDQLVSITTDANGKPNVTPNLQKMFLVANILADKNNGNDFINALAQHYKTLGAKSAIAPIENPSNSNTPASPLTPEAKPRSIAEAMARQGRIA